MSAYFITIHIQDLQMSWTPAPITLDYSEPPKVPRPTNVLERGRLVLGHFHTHKYPSKISTIQIKIYLIFK